MLGLLDLIHIDEAAATAHVVMIAAANALGDYDDAGTLTEQGSRDMAAALSGAAKYLDLAMRRKALLEKREHLDEIGEETAARG